MSSVGHPSPPQVRAARALLGLTQDQLAKLASVGLTALRDFEAERRSSDGATVAGIARVLEARGIQFVFADGAGGSGVRFADTRPLLSRSPHVRPSEGVGFAVDWQGERFGVLVSSEALEDLEGLHRTATFDELLEAFERHRVLILEAVARNHLDRRNFDPKGRLLVRSRDLNEPPRTFDIETIPPGHHRVRLSPPPIRVLGAGAAAQAPYSNLWIVEHVAGQPFLTAEHTVSGSRLQLYPAHIREFRAAAESDKGVHELRLFVQVVHSAGFARLERLP